ncbi:MAG: hypothetical protein D6702_12710 [Planctomycetota bacterium]|nr:MAG: hypothetical protein D6702_12710 [Planctomycetota bacterium]
MAGPSRFHPWMLVPVGLLLLSLGIGAVTLVLALSDPGFAVEKDYYRKGLEWDRELAQERRNRELGWRAEIEAGVDPAAATVPFLVRLVDAGGGPVVGAAVEVEAFHLARSAEPFRTPLEEVSPGRYRGTLPLRRAGKWEFRLRAVRGEEVFTDRQQRLLFSGPPGAEEG